MHHKDATGHEIEQKLLKKVKALSNVEVYDHFFATDLILDEEHSTPTCLGIYTIDRLEQKSVSIFSKPWPIGQER